MTNIKHFIYDENTKNLIDSVDKIENDDNDGLPEWFFENFMEIEGPHYINFEFNTETNEIEWIPPMGPAPIFKTKYVNDEKLWEEFEAWSKVTF